MTGRVLVTGAAGRLGSRVATHLHVAGFVVAATDVVEPQDPTHQFTRADLLDSSAVSALVEGCETVVHLGNHPGLGGRRPQDVFNENVTMNENVFQAAAESGVQRLVFSSTLQLIGSHLDDRTVVTRAQQPELPMDSQTPPNPSNLYALSKTVSEVMLRYYAERCGIDCVALGFPMLQNHDDWCRVGSGDETETDILEAFTGLTYDDAAELVRAVLRADLPGYRCYAPATAHRHLDMTVPELVKKFYPDASPGLTDLVDVTQITAETGWKLGDYPRVTIDQEASSL